jgi:hypothetical protein
MPCYEVKTEPDGVTMLMNAQGLPVSLIEWQYPPFVEIRDGLPKQPVQSWLRISCDQQYV